MAFSEVGRIVATLRCFVPARGTSPCYVKAPPPQRSRARVRRPPTIESLMTRSKTICRGMASAQSCVLALNHGDSTGLGAEGLAQGGEQGEEGGAGQLLVRRLRPVPRRGAAPPGAVRGAKGQGAGGRVDRPRWWEGSRRGIRAEARPDVPRRPRRQR